MLNNISRNCGPLGASVCLEAKPYPHSLPSKEKGFIESIKLENQYPTNHVYICLGLERILLDFSCTNYKQKWVQFYLYLVYPNPS